MSWGVLCLCESLSSQLAEDVRADHGALGPEALESPAWRPLGSENRRGMGGLEPLGSAVPNIFGTREQFCGRQFFHEQGVELRDGLGIIQVHYIYCALYITIISAPPQIIRH